MFWITVISIVIVSGFFTMGWAYAQRIFTWAKLIGSVFVICAPFTVIWWIIELIDWPTNLMQLLYPIYVLWVPYILGNLLHQILYFVKNRTRG